MNNDLGLSGGNLLTDCFLKKCKLIFSNMLMSDIDVTLGEIFYGQKISPILEHDLTLSILVQPS